MRLRKATRCSVERLEGTSKGSGSFMVIWQYPNEVLIEVDGVLIRINRQKLKKFLGRKCK